MASLITALVCTIRLPLESCLEYNISGNTKEVTLAKRAGTFKGEKRRKELSRQKKQEEKRQRRLSKENKPQETIEGTDSEEKAEEQ